MKNFKVFLWIFIVFLIQTVVLPHIHVFAAAPSIVLAYAVSVMMLENEFHRAAVINVICAVVMGALGGRDFTIVTLFYTYVLIAAFALRKKPAYIGFCPKAIAWTVLPASVLEIIFLLIEMGTITTHMLVYDVLATAVFDVVLTIIVYPILKRTMYREIEKKILIT